MSHLGPREGYAKACGGWASTVWCTACRIGRRTSVRPSHALLLGERGFFRYERGKELVSRGLRALIGLNSNMVLQPIRHLGDGSNLAKVDPHNYARKTDRHGLPVRVICYKLDDLPCVGHEEEHVLITNLMDENELPASERIPLYH